MPDDVYAAAEGVAKQLGVSRSRLYARAIKAYVDQHKTDGITQRLNDLYAVESVRLDPDLGALQASSLPKERW